MKIFAWTIPAAVAFSALCYSVAIYNIEHTKQAAFMMKACVDAGGSWLRKWNNSPYCQRPETTR